MTEMIERVAKAIGHTLTDDQGWLKKSYSDDDMRAIARAAIEAMREPTDAMARAAQTAADSMGGDELELFQPEAGKIIWRGMIDAALSAAAPETFGATGDSASPSPE